MVCADIVDVQIDRIFCAAGAAHGDSDIYERRGYQRW
jgi:hypothetical protein